MKIHSLILLLIGLSACSNVNKWQTQKQNHSSEKKEIISEYAQKLLNYRDSTSAMFLSGANGVLLKKELSRDGSLHYFEPNEEYKVAATFQKVENGKEFEMKTSTDRLPMYRVYGTLSFQIEGEKLTLTVYQNVDQPEHLFCPFKDKTNGVESYGAGRYLDFKLADLANPIIDFNYCYNPYCAYNYKYSCPIPPMENHLKISISAGEKNWH